MVSSVKIKIVLNVNEVGSVQAVQCAAYNSIAIDPQSFCEKKLRSWQLDYSRWQYGDNFSSSFKGGAAEQNQCA
jgi:hypothetical protein